MLNPQTAEARYKQLESKRQPYLDRARECSKLTLPGLFPPQGSNEFTEFKTPYQNVGSEGVNNLSSKLLLALLPPNSPFFRLRIDEAVLIQNEQQDPKFRAEIDKALSMTEQAVMAEIETTGDRTVFFEACKHLLVAGNVMLFLPKTGSMRVFRLDKFVIKRAPDGMVLEIITKECTTPEALPKQAKAILGRDTETEETNKDKTVDIYTHIKRNGSHWVIYQELKGQVVPNSQGTVPIDKSPYIPLRYARVDGEDYGRAFVEEYFGDLKSLEGLTKAILEGSAAAAKILVGVKPNGNTSIKDVQNAENGDIIPGDEGDVWFLQANKLSDFQVASNEKTTIQQRLERAFLLFSGAQRQAERVTKEEIKQVVSELEERLGGFYSILAQEFQAPYIDRKMFVMQQARKLPALPKKIVKTAIVTGLEALGRSQELQKIQTWKQMMQEFFGQDAAKYCDPEEVSKRISTALQFDDKGLMKSKETLQAEMSAAKDAAMQEKLMPNLVNAGGRMIQEGMKQNATGQVA